MARTETQPLIIESVSNPLVASVSQLALTGSVEINHPQAELLQSIERGPDLLLPTTFMNDEQAVVPSFDVITLLGNRVSLVDIHATDKSLNGFYNDTIQAGKGVRNRVEGMFLESVVRIMDTNGAQGLHHVHGTIFPNTVFQVVKRGSGIVPNIFVTKLGETDGQAPVLALVTATRDKQAEYKLFNLLGVGNQKKKRTA